MRMSPNPISAAVGAAALAVGLLSSLFAATSILAAPVTVAFDNPSSMAIPDTSVVDSPIVVAGVNGPIIRLRVSVHLIHPVPDDLVLRLVGPDGTELILSEENGAGGADNGEPGENYGTAAQPVTARTIFDDEAIEYIYDANAPFAGFFKPEEAGLSETFSGKTANGTWILRIEDLYEEDTGQLQVWGLEITTDVP
jgi:subtilisin-like proprotein convertase family protein